MKLDTVWPADTVEFCPHVNARNVFVCGTYNLENRSHDEGPPIATILSSDPDSLDNQVPEAPRMQKRRGKCIVIENMDGSSDLKVTQELELPAVLDMKWSYCESEGDPYLAIADSEGHITLAQWIIHEKILQVKQTVDCRPPSALCLSLDWSDRLSRSFGDLVVSASDGSLSLLRRSSNGSLEISRNWHAHDYEPWIAAWDYWDTNVCYSGGDDLKLKGWDIRESSTKPTFTNSRFEAGVTSIQCSPHNEKLFAVGSYDEKVRIFDKRNPSLPRCEVPVGGGIWRIKWHPSETRCNDLLVACMHDGVKVVRFSGTSVDKFSVLEKGDDWEITKRFDMHESMAYGVDWCHQNVDNGSQSIIASCSFYDHSLYTWEG